MALLVRGTVDILVGSQFLQAAQAPTWFGEMTLLGLCDKRTATVQARTFCEVWLLHRGDFLDALQQHPEQTMQLRLLAEERVNYLAQERTCISGLDKIEIFKD